MKTSTYKFISNEEVFNMVLTALTDSKIEFGMQELKCANTKIQWRFTLNKEISLDGDIVRPMIIVTNAEVAGTALRFNAGFYRAICTNGLVMGTDLYSAKIIHRIGRTFDEKYDGIADQIAAMIQYFSSGFEEDMADLKTSTIDDSKATEIIGNLNVPIKVKDAAIYSLNFPRRVEDADKSMFSLWNIVNEEIRLCVPSNHARIVYNKNLLRDINDLNAA